MIDTPGLCRDSEEAEDDALRGGKGPNLQLYPGGAASLLLFYIKTSCSFCCHELAEIELSVKIADGIEDSTGQAGVDALMIVLSLAACLTRGELAALDAVRKRLGHRCFEHRGLVVWTHADIVEVGGCRKC